MNITAHDYYKYIVLVVRATTTTSESLSGKSLKCVLQVLLDTIETVAPVSSLTFRL